MTYFGTKRSVLISISKINVDAKISELTHDALNIDVYDINIVRIKNI